MNAERLRATQALGRKVALAFNVDPDDGEQQAVLEGLEVERWEASQPTPKTLIAYLGCVKNRLEQPNRGLMKHRFLVFDPAYGGQVENTDGDADEE